MILKYKHIAQSRQFPYHGVQEHFLLPLRLCVVHDETHPSLIPKCYKSLKLVGKLLLHCSKIWIILHIKKKGL